MTASAPPNKTDLINSLIAELAALKSGNEPALDALRRRAEMIIRNSFGPDSRYLEDLRRIRFYPMVLGSTPAMDQRAWLSGSHQLLNLFATMKEEVLLFDNASPQPTPHTQPPPSLMIFIAHGHDEAMKESVARVVEKLGLQPVILHEKADRGRTVIEKFTESSDVGFAVILLSPDDIGYDRATNPSTPNYRSRQNVVFELGYFIGKLGRRNVVALHRTDDPFEMPSDISGVLYVPFDAAGRWQFDLVRELKAAGYDIDANRLLQ